MATEAKPGGLVHYVTISRSETLQKNLSISGLQWLSFKSKRSVLRDAETLQMDLHLCEDAGSLMLYKKNYSGRRPSSVLLNDLRNDLL